MRLYYPIRVIRNRLGLKRFPSFLTYTVTWPCNAKCVMCDSWRKPVNEPDLTLEEIEGFFQQLKRMDAVRITGGEPFIRRDIHDIVNLADFYLRPTYIHITTNGFLTQVIVQSISKVRKKSKLQIKISIDAFEEHHDLIRGTRGAYQRAKETAICLKEIADKENFVVAINQTIVNHDSLADYERIQADFDPYGITVCPYLAYKGSATYHIDSSIQMGPPYPGYFEPFGDFTSDELVAFFKKVEGKVRKTNSPVINLLRNYYLKGMIQRLQKEKDGQLLNPKCVALRDHLRLYPDGDIPVCQFNSEIVGNIRRQSFEEIWFGSDISSKRRWVDGCPGCWAGCEVLPSAVYTGDVYKGISL